MKIDDVSFTEGFVESFKTEEEFLTEMNQPGYFHIYQGPNRQEKLKEAYALHNPKKKATAKEKSD